MKHITVQVSARRYIIAREDGGTDNGSNFAKCSIPMVWAKAQKLVTILNQEKKLANFYQEWGWAVIGGGW